MTRYPVAAVNSSEFTVRLKDVRFFARHGVFGHEMRDGNEFRLDLSVSFPVSGEEKEILSDSLGNSVSYVSLYEIAKSEMEVPRALLETVAYRIGRRILRDFPGISSIECEITKLSPPIAGFTGEASASFNYKNKDSQ